MLLHHHVNAFFWDAGAYQRCCSALGEILNTFLSFQRGVLGVGHTPVWKRVHGSYEPICSTGAGEFSVHPQDYCISL